ncbi:MAG: putative transposase [Candidatus Poribacteria bacterium]|nr:putative transposase [Candidatus Poribacteria bacterium]
MKLSMKLKLITTETQKQALLDTMQRFNSACDYISNIAFENKAFGQIRLHKLTYYEVRDKFGLASQMAVRAIGKVVESYKVEKQHKHTFKPYGAIVYDSRILKFKFPDKISISTLEGRQVISFLFQNYRNLDMRRVAGQADLVYQDGIFYLVACVDVPEPPQNEPDNFLGVDLGIINVASDNTGTQYAGNKLNSVRNRYYKLRKKLQKKRTKSAKRLLKKRKRKENRFAKDTNHIISKQLVNKAKALGLGIALENLQGIRDRVTVRKPNRRQHASWSFFDLRTKIAYKAQLAGVKIVLVDPRNTSRMCSVCSFVSKKNRPTQSIFLCQVCGHSCNADLNASMNIAVRARATVNLPDVACDETKAA